MEEKKRSRLRIIFRVLLCYLLFAAAAILLIDGRHPHFYMVGGQQIQTGYGEAFEDPGVYARLEGNIFGEWEKDLPVRATGAVNTGILGDYELEYSTRFLLQDWTCTRTVSVVDRTAPVITLRVGTGSRVSWLDGYEEEGYTATDDVDGDITDRVEIREEASGIVYTVRDRAGNESSVTRFPYEEVSRPEITLLGGEELRIPAALSFEDPGCTVTDSFGNDLSGMLERSGAVIPYRAGTYPLVYTVTNRRGDCVEKTRTVTVLGQPAPEEKIPDEPTIYLTFDDGPGPYTDALLDVLKEYDAKATFFVTCTNPKYADCIGRAFREGHAIGVHSASHSYQKIYAGEEAFFEDFWKVQELIYAQTGQYTELCRFPGGSSNTVSSTNPGIMTRLAGDLQDLGYQYFDWDVKSGDAGETKSTDKVFQNVTEGVAGQPYAIVLQHDIKSFSVKAVEKILRWGRDNGYVFRALDRNCPPAHHEIVN